MTADGSMLAVPFFTTLAVVFWPVLLALHLFLQPSTTLRRGFKISKKEGIPMEKLQNLQAKGA